MEEFELKGDFIQLNQLIKVLNWAHSGGVASLLIDEGEVTVNQEPESRKRRKIRIGDEVQFGEKRVKIIASS